MYIINDKTKEENRTSTIQNDIIHQTLDPLPIGRVVTVSFGVEGRTVVVTEKKTWNINVQGFIHD